jgi:hypothetical protein
MLEDLQELRKELAMNNIQEVYIAGRNKLIVKKMKTPKTLITVRDSNNRIIVRLYRPKSYIALSYHKILELLKRK